MGAMMVMETDHGKAYGHMPDGGLRASS